MGEPCNIILSRALPRFCIFAGVSHGPSPTQSLGSSLTRETRWNVLDYEILQQKAQTLGTLGRQVEQALESLHAFDAGGHGASPDKGRGALLDEPADRVWAFMIQRELCCLRHWETAVRDCGIPREVLNRVGQVRPKTA